MKRQKYKKNEQYLRNICLLSIFIFIVSCRSTDSGISDNSGKSILKVNLLGVESSVSSEKIAASTKVIVPPLSTNKQTIRFDDHHDIIATLIQEPSQTKENLAGIIPMAATTLTNSKLVDGTKYRVIAYDDKGSYIADKVFISGQNDKGLQDGFELYGGNFNFIAYSINSKTDLPELPSEYTTLSKASLKSVVGDLMDFRNLNKAIKGGETNYLDILLKHRYSQITTKIDASSVGNITNIQASFSPVSTSADLLIANGNLGYNGPSTSVTVDFSDNSNNPIYISKPTILISDNNSLGQLNLSSLTIGGVTKNLTINNLKFTPGVKYNLNLELDYKPDLYTIISIGQDASYIQSGIPIIGSEPTNGGIGSGSALLGAVNNKLLKVVTNLGIPQNKIEFLGLIPDKTESRGGLQKIFNQTTSDGKKRNVIFIYTGYNKNATYNTDEINKIINNEYLNKGKIYFVSSDENSVGNGNWTSTTYFGGTNSYGRANSNKPRYTINGPDLVETGDVFPTVWGNVTSSGEISSQYLGGGLYPSTNNAKVISRISADNWDLFDPLNFGQSGQIIIFKDLRYGNGKLWVFGDTDAYWQYSKKLINLDGYDYHALPLLDDGCTSNQRNIFTCNMFHYVIDKNLKAK